MWNSIKADIRRQTQREKGVARKLGTVLLHAGLHAVLLFRVSSWLYQHQLRPLAALVSYMNAWLTGAQISPRARIGKGLAIYHPHGIVIGATTVIGDDCTLAHNNVIGQLYGGDDRPTIGNDFFAGTGAKILGRIRIGDRVHVGANAVVYRSLSDGVTVAAAQARIVPTLSTETDPDAGARVVVVASSRKEIARRVTSIVTTIVDGGRNGHVISEETVLLDEGIGLNSIEVISLINAVEAEFDLTLDERDVGVEQLKTVGSLVSFLEHQMPR